MTEVPRVTGVTRSSEMRGELLTTALCPISAKLTSCRGVPVVKASQESSAESKAKRDAATADALAKAKAMVEAEQKKSAGKDGEMAELKERVAEVEAETPENGIKSEAVKGEKDKKRAREGDDEAGPEPKKVDSKSEAVEATNGQS